MKNENSSLDEYSTLENAVYEVSDQLLVLKAYCNYHYENNKKIEHIKDMVNKLSDSFDIIAEKF